MTLTIPDIALEKMNVTQEELRLELAVLLYEKQSLSFGQAKTLAGLSHLEFQHALKERNVPLNYDIEAFHEDLKTLGIQPKDD
jgi:predicted HTH domain antitoxin